MKKGLGRASLQAGLGWVIILALVFYSLVIQDRAEEPSVMDFSLFYRAAEHLRDGIGIYEPIPTAGNRFADSLTTEGRSDFLPNLNPPFQAVLFYPFTHLKLRTAYLVWSAFSLVCGLLGAIIIGSARPGGRDKATSALVMAVLLLLYFPTCMNLIHGQWSLVAFLMLALAWQTWRNGRLSTAGAILGSFAAIKLFAGAFLLFFVARREWRAAIAFVSAWLFFTAGSAVIAGPESLVDYVGVLGKVDWHSLPWNASFSGFFARVFGGVGNVPLVHAPRIGWILGGGFSFLGILMLFKMAMRIGTSENKEMMNDLAFSACLVLMLLVSPLGWMYYFPVLLIPFLVLWEGSRWVPGSGKLRGLGILAWLLSTVPRFQGEGPGAGGDPGFILGWAGTYFYALILFLGLIWVMQKRIVVGTAPR